MARKPECYELPKRYWGACECGTPFMLERADRCAFCEEEI